MTVLVAVNMIFFRVTKLKDGSGKDELSGLRYELFRQILTF